MAVSQELLWMQSLMVYTHFLLSIYPAQSWRHCFVWSGFCQYGDVSRSSQSSACTRVTDSDWCIYFIFQIIIWELHTWALYVSTLLPLPSPLASPPEFMMSSLYYHFTIHIHTNTHMCVHTDRCIHTGKCIHTTMSPANYFGLDSLCENSFLEETRTYL